MNSKYLTKLFNCFLPVLCLTALFLGGCLAGNPKYLTDSKKYHIVEKGDSLSKIALENGTSVKKIMIYNNLVSDLIFPGQKLYLYPKIRGKNEYITVRSIPKKGYHIVKQKEDLQRIARMYDLSIIELLDFNNKNSFEINAGEKIWLVGGKVSESEQTSSSIQAAVDPEDKNVTKDFAAGTSDYSYSKDKKNVTKDISDDLKSKDLEKSGKKNSKVDKGAKEKAERKLTVNPVVTPEAKSKESSVQLPEAGEVALPVNGTVTSEFGMRRGKPHKGIDIAAAKGTPILAALAGKAVYVGSQRGYGNVVIIEHKNLTMTVYAHNESNLIRLGDKVGKAQPIATVGDTGATSGAHLHFEYRVKGKAIDPREVLPEF